MSSNPQTMPASTANTDDTATREWISALADGDPAAADHACKLWRDDDDARRSWHAYHLIGDALRSDELAASPARDAAFLDRLRTRLASEPVPLAPAPTRRRLPWLAPFAAAAGVAAVAGAMVATRTSLPGSGGAETVAVGSRADPSLRRAGALPSQPQTPLQVEGRIVRDPRLEAYFRAHREAMGASPVVLPGAVPRAIETVAPVAPAGR